MIYLKSLILLKYYMGYIMAKIFISAFSGNLDPNNKYALPCFIDSFLYELKKAGNDILFFSSPYFVFKKGQKAPLEIIQKLQQFSPDLIILFNNCFYDYDFSESFSCPIVVLEVDSYLYFSNKHILENKKNNYHYIVQANDSIENIHQILAVPYSRIHRVPVFTSVVSTSIAKTANIVFIGSFFSYTNYVRNLALNSPTKKEINEFKKICSYIEKDPFVSQEKLKKDIVITSKFLNENLDVEKIGAFVCSYNRIKTLSSVAPLGLDLYGTISWINVLDFYPEIALSFINKKVYSLHDNQNIYNSAKIGISISHIQARSGFPLRIMDIMASSACLVSDYHDDFELYFPKVKIPIFSSPNEAYDVCKKLLEEDNLREEIIAQCNEIIEKKYRFNRYRKDLEDITGISLLSNRIGNINYLFEFKESLPIECYHQTNNLPFEFSFKNKIRYKIWKHLGKKLRKKGIIQ